MVPKTFLITPYHSLSVYLSWYGSYTMHDTILALKGESNVVSELAKLMVNSIAGSLETQSIWDGDTMDLNIWVTMQLAHSVTPSDSGW